jgi:hypothetical protein
MSDASLYVEVLQDPFSAKYDAAQKRGGIGSRVTASNETNHIRRPTRGLTLKEDTFATLTVVSRKDGKQLSLVDAGSRRRDSDTGQILEVLGSDGSHKRATDIYSNFLLQTVQEERVEKSQILETFGEPYIFFFGERARVQNFAGILINSADFNWEAEWWYNYDNLLRGTRCVESDARIYLSYDDTLVSGYMMSSNAVKDTNNPRFVNFQFQLFITSYTTLSKLGNPSAYNANKAPFSGARNLTNLGGNVIFTTAELEAQRPKLIPFNIPIDGGGIGVQENFIGPPEKVGLIQSMENRFQQVKKAMAQASSVVNYASGGISGLLNGDRVRVPVGFAGSLEYDVDQPRLNYTLKYNNVVSFSTFAENKDEYVGSGDQYGTSFKSLDRTNFLSNLGETSLESETKYGQQMIEDATAIWEQEGIKVDQKEMGPVSRAIIGKGVGLLAIGAAGVVQAASTIPETVSQVATRSFNGIGSLAFKANRTAVAQLLSEAPNVAIRFGDAIPGLLTDLAKPFVE